MTYYEKYKTDPGKLFDEDFNRTYATGSKNVSDEKDTKKDEIGITPNQEKNIEDRYYGESDKTFDNDSKYFHPDNKTSSNTLLYILGAVGIIAFIKR